MRRKEAVASVAGGGVSSADAMAMADLVRLETANRHGHPHHGHGHGGIHREGTPNKTFPLVHSAEEPMPTTPGAMALPLLGSPFSPSPATRPSCSPRRNCGTAARMNLRCSMEEKVPPRNNGISKHLLSCLAASLVFIAPPSQAIPADTFAQPSLCQVAVVAAIDKGVVPLKFDGPSDDGGSGMMMMKGMTAKNFDPVRYSGRWFEVASLKRGFAGQGQEDCHCTQGVYTFDEKSRAIQVETFCVHGSPDGYITGIRGRVQCLSEEDMASAETDLEREEMIRSKCFLRFPTLPFIPKLPYDVIATDYDNYAVVSGAKDASFIQIYSRTPNPGPEFIEKYKSYAANFGYDPSKIKDTPQDCEVSSDQLAQMMSMPGMDETLTNQFPDLKLKSSVAFDPFTSVTQTLKKLVELYFK
ncbi:hypothetical protein ACQ4PT_041364 [Festuca glaucescens]